MNLVIPTKPLAEAAALVAGMTSRHLGTNLPVLNHVLLTDTGKGELQMAVSDMDLSARLTVQTSEASLMEHEEEKIAVPADVFSSQLKSISQLSECVTLRLTDNQRLQIKTRRSTAHVVGIGGDEFPSIPFDLPEAKINLEAREWRYLFTTTVHAADTALADQFALTGLQLTYAGDTVRSASTDQHRMGLANVTVPVKRDVSYSVFLPRHLVAHGLKLLNHLNDECPVWLGDNGNLIYFWTDGRILLSRMVGGKRFPEFSHLLKGDTSRRLIVSRDELARVVEAAMPFADRGAQAPPRVQLVYANGSIEVTCENGTVGEYSAEVPVVTPGECPGFTFRLNPTYLADFLGSLKTEEVVMIAPGQGAQAPLQLRPAPGDSDALAFWCAPMA